MTILPLKKVAYNQKFNYRGDVWRLVMKDCRYRDGVTMVYIKSGNKQYWIDWETEVEVI
jgi:hypothetical protein